jgi:hypothetical protein
MRATFTVYFEGPFWVGLLESEEGGRLVVARHVYGAEPTNAELLRFMLYEYHLMPRSAVSIADAPSGRSGPSRPSPKRAIREARKAMLRGPSSRSREALSSALEASKGESEAERRVRERADEERLFALRAERKKERHRGH